MGRFPLAMIDYLPRPVRPVADQRQVNVPGWGLDLSINHRQVSFFYLPQFELAAQMSMCVTVSG